MPRIKPKSAVCQVNALPTVLSFQFISFKIYIWGKRDSTVVKAPAWHSSDPDLIYGIIHSLSSNTRSNP